MNRNQKIGLGCGVAGCLGLILIVIIAIVLFGGTILALIGLGSTNRNDNSNVNSSSNANDNPSSDRNSDSKSSTSRSTMSEDDKHKLMQAAGMTKDSELMQRVLRKLGFITDTGTSDDYPQFIKDHVTWARKNFQFIRSVNTPLAARAYVDAHIND